MRPEFAWGPDSDEEKRRILLLRLNEFKERCNNMVDTAESLYPFVPENIYQDIHKCMKQAQIEVMHIETAGHTTFSLQWYEDGAKQRDKFNEHYYTAVRLAREHFKRLTVISQQR